MKKIQALITSLTMAVVILTGVHAALTPTATLSAASSSKIDSVEIPNTGLGSSDLPTVIGSIVKVVLSVTGIILFVLFFYGGFKMLTAAGDDEKVAEGKRVIIQAIIGLLVVLVSYALATFVLDKLLGATGSSR
jgi:hypothetical protein